MNTDVLVIRPLVPFSKGEDMVKVREMALRQMKEGIIMLPFGYEVVKVSEDVDVRVTPDKDERKVIHNATTYICIAEKNGRPAEAENLAQKLYDRAYRKGFEAGKATGKISNSDPNDRSGDRMGG